MLLAFLITLLHPLAHASSDALFARMQGDWRGEGVRVYPISGRRVQIDAQVHSTVQVVDGSPVLVSNNQITERPANGVPKGYMTRYWVRADLQRPGVYELGALGSQQVSSTGELKPDGGFEVQQNLGGNPPAMIDSVTRFTANTATYTETFTIGAEVQARTEIQYKRTAP